MKLVIDRKRKDFLDVFKDFNDFKLYVENNFKIDLNNNELLNKLLLVYNSLILSDDVCQMIRFTRYLPKQFGWKHKNIYQIRFWVERGFSEEYAKQQITFLKSKLSQKMIDYKETVKIENFLSYDDCKNFVKSNNIKTKQEYFNFDKPKNIPYNPSTFYKSVWLNWKQFLTDKNSRRNILCYTYSECKEIIKKYNIKSKSDWFKNIKNIITIDEKIPYDPLKYYKKEFNGWGDFLNTGKIQDNKIKFLSYDETQKYVKNLKLKNCAEWKEYCKTKPNFITSKPKKKFKNDFIDMPTFLGYNKMNSIGENIIKDYLNENNIIFIKEKRFDDCKNIRSLPFDFYIPDYNICIEFDGPQHEKLSNHFNMTEDDFKKLQKNDEIKTSYCKNNNIRLIRIPYKYKNNIIEILNKNIK